MSEELKNNVEFKEEVVKVTKGVINMLVEKNRKYGDSALNPKRIFSKANDLEQIYVRLDDKLSRIANRQDDEDEDVLDDLLGYLFLAKICLNRKKAKEAQEVETTQE
jgi:hypothetical protein